MRLESLFLVVAILVVGIISVGFTLVLNNQERSLKNWRKIMANQADLAAAIATLKTDLEALIAALKPVDLQPQIDAVNALDAEVKAAMPT